MNDRVEKFHSISQEWEHSLAFRLLFKEFYKSY